MKKMKNKVTNILSKKAFVLLAAFGILALSLCLVSIAIVGYGAIKTASVDHHKILNNDQSTLILQAKQNYITSYIIENNTQTIQQGLNCYSMITGQDKRSILESIAKASTDEKVSEKIDEIISSTSISEEPARRSLIMGIKDCFEIYAVNG